MFFERVLFYRAVIINFNFKKMDGKFYFGLQMDFYVGWHLSRGLKKWPYFFKNLTLMRDI